ncbi:MAG: DNA gyrase inhibitor YacG [Deltaproteobacteria bacterium]|jgi:endogenous inhibitor of DNA gyrase (YacG/DUF329 family)|nr:DNA gyrase inhibitor YacG [Deltaproteobacteria bacterium]MBW2503343.1 DNA gyrase inhibitor YacG [Deltaproteobacteria bacterium]MBW2520301.1 DNA gyrase inhibitor YacG [Deltaproteobacteria bacterium]
MGSQINKIECPRCRKIVAWEKNPHRPFCSEYCRLVDLGRWSDETYRISSRSEDGDELDNLVTLNPKREKN